MPASAWPSTMHSLILWGSISVASGAGFVPARTAIATAVHGRVPRRHGVVVSAPDHEAFVVKAVLAGNVGVVGRARVRRESATLRAVDTPPTPIATMTLAGPDGPLTVAATERGVVAADWAAGPDEILGLLTRRLGSLTEATNAARAILERARPILEALLAGQAPDASAVPIDLRDRPAFDRAVLLSVRDVPWGQTASYGEIARRVGAPRAARAVGGAVGRCPIAVLIPCHRIIAADGKLGGFGGDGRSGRADALMHKQALLAREGVTVRYRAD